MPMTSSSSAAGTRLRMTWTKAVMAKLGLTLNEAKPSLKDARRESFDFLGYTLGPRHFPNGGRWYLGASPSKQSVQRVKAKISELCWCRVTKAPGMKYEHG